MPITLVNVGLIKQTMTDNGTIAAEPVDLWESHQCETQVNVPTSSASQALPGSERSFRGSQVRRK
jgi:hypothetical protein